MFKLTQSGRIAVFVFGVIALLCFKSLVSEILFSVSKWNSKKSLSHQINDINPNFLLSNSLKDEDPFSKEDFLNKKFMQLISSSHASKSSPKSINNTLDTKVDFSYLLHELIVVVNAKNFFSFLLGCKEVATIQTKDVIHETMTRLSYSGSYQTKNVIVEVAKPNVDELISADCGSLQSDHSQENLDRCFLLKNRRVLDEASLLVQLSHQNIAKILGLCIQSTNNQIKLDMKISKAGVVLVKETGFPARIEDLKSRDWEERLKVCLDLLNLAVYFSTSPLGSLRLQSWNVNNFIFNSETNKIQLHDFDQSLYFIEPSCSTDEQCFVDGINCGIKCASSLCVGYNAKKNLFELNKVFLSPLLRHDPPPTLSTQVQTTLININSLKVSALEAFNKLQTIFPKEKRNHLDTPKVIKNVDDIDSNNDPAVLNMQRLPDGSEVDSWEKHESKVIINEVEVNLLDKQAHAENEPPVKAPLDGIIINGFRKMENSDFPGRFDYSCPHSRADWGCVFSLSSTEEAMDKCLNDFKCKSLVTLPHIRKQGWIIAILKSDNADFVKHAGTTVYVRLTSDGAVLSPDLPRLDAVDIVNHRECLAQIAESQSLTRKSLEAKLMKLSGWPGMTDDRWSSGIEEGKIKDATSFKPARGKDAVGGQMDIQIEFNFDSYPGVFLAKQGPEEFSVSQLALFQLDRILGLYKTLPAIERRLSRGDLAEAGFPVDIGGNLLDYFHSLKHADGSLVGVVYPKIKERISIEYYISVPKLSAITNAVTPFNKKQWDDIEYLLLGYLGSVPFPLKGHPSARGRLLYLKTENSFLRTPLDYFSYFYNCQFPLHVIQVLRLSEKRRCDIGSAISSELINSDSPPISNVIRGNVRKLLDLVNQCVKRFGEDAVLYKSNVDS